jgi:hypothetical protein
LDEAMAPGPCARERPGRTRGRRRWRGWRGMLGREASAASPYIPGCEGVAPGEGEALYILSPPIPASPLLVVLATRIQNLDMGCKYQPLKTRAWKCLIFPGI